MEYLNDINAPEEPSVLRRGIYIKQINKLYELFISDQTLILGFKELTENNVQTLNKILKFIGLPEIDWKFLNIDNVTSGNYKNNMSEEMRNFLVQFYKPYNEELFKKLEKNYIGNIFKLRERLLQVCYPPN